MVEQKNALFPALLKFWRTRRGMSQLDLSLAADTSARHVSFLETGRAKPSRNMILSLASTLHIPMREQNALLRAAGFEEVYQEPAFSSLAGSALGGVINTMLEKHNPYPMVVMNGHYELLAANESAEKILQTFIAKPEGAGNQLNLLEAIFHPDLSKPYVEDWDATARTMLSRLHRESLERNYDEDLQALLKRILAIPGVPAEWVLPDFDAPCDPISSLTLERDEWRFAFTMTMTGFSAPQNITVEELMIEGYFPIDEATNRACQKLMAWEG